MSLHAETNHLPIAIIVVGYDGAPWLPPLLKTLKESVRTVDHLLVIDNGGNEDSIPSEFPECNYTVLHAPRRMGFCDANNFALEQLPPCELVCFLNQDVVVDREWLNSIINVFEENPTIGAASPVHMTYDFRSINPNFRATLRPSRLTMKRRCEGKNLFFSCDNLIAAAMFVRRSVLKKVGGFDPIFGSYYEDFDLCRRIRESGFSTVVVPTSVVAHFDGSATRSIAAIRKRERQVLRNSAILSVRSSHSRITALIKIMSVNFPRRLFRALLRRSGSKHWTSVILAYADLFRVSPRVVSGTVDNYFSKKAWSKITR